MVKRFAFFAGLLWAGAAFGQSNPGWHTGTVPTAAQWNAQWAGKVDVTNGSLAAPTISGTVSGTPTVSGAWTFTAAPSFSAGATLGGNLDGSPTFTGSPVFSGTLSVTGAGTALSVTNNATVGGTATIGAGSNNILTITPGATTASALVLAASSGNTGGVQITTGSTGLFVGPAGASKATMGFLETPGNTVTLSGGTDPGKIARIRANYAGSSTISNNTTLAIAQISSASDNAGIPNGTLNGLLIAPNYGGTSYTGSRTGLRVQMNFNTASTNTGAADYLVGIGSTSVASANMGGTSTGYGVSSFGAGSVFGSNPWCRLQTGATYFRQCVGAEVDASIQTGANSARFAIMQLVLTDDHAVHGVNTDAGLLIAAQVGASVGVRKLITAGDYTGQFPLDANGILFQVQSSQNNVATVGAGGFDLNQFTASGTAVEGGGFMWRSPGVQIKDTEGQFGYWRLVADSNGLLIDTGYQYMGTAAGSITVGAGGTGWTTGDVACDAYGDCVTLTASAGAVTAVSSVLSRGWQASPPADPVAFTARTRSGSSYGASLTLNLGAWTSKTQITIGSSTAASAMGGSLALKNTVVASLPTCNAGAKYKTYVVSDANAPTYGANLAGGGAVVALALCDGTNWTAH